MFSDVGKDLGEVACRETWKSVFIMVVKGDVGVNVSFGEFGERLVAIRTFFEGDKV